MCPNTSGARHGTGDCKAVDVVATGHALNGLAKAASQIALIFSSRRSGRASLEAAPLLPGCLRLLFLARPVLAFLVPELGTGRAAVGGGAEVEITAGDARQALVVGLGRGDHPVIAAHPIGVEPAARIGHDA